VGLFERAASGDGKALARLTTLVENDDPATLAALDALGDPPQSPYVIGLTGPPGAGKSTLINSLLPHLASFRKIAVLLVDPSSQITGGAVLGDRVRMLDWGDDRVFVRSQATRGQEGGLSPSTSAMIDLFAHLSFDLVLIETVGVGQDGVDIRAVCDTTIVVQSPNAGDAVQSLKAGILEIADLYVVTKADLAGSHNTVRDLGVMIQLADYAADDWIPRVIPVSAQDQRGFDQLAAGLADHRPAGKQRNFQDRRRWETRKRATTAIRKAVSAGDADDGSRAKRIHSALSAALASIEQPG
jgi:LAO/AO transport system kinase